MRLASVIVGDRWGVLGNGNLNYGVDSMERPVHNREPEEAG